MNEVRLVEDLEQLGHDKSHEDESVSREEAAPQIDDEGEKQDGGDLDAAEQRNALEQQVLWRIPRARHRVLNVVVGHVHPAQRDRDGQHQEPDRQHGDRHEPGEKCPQCWQRRQNTVVRPAMRTADSGRPQV